MLPKLCLLLTFIGCVWCGQVRAEQTTFTEFALDLPEGWSGDERSGFSSGDRREYMLSLGKKDLTEENYVAQVTIYLLPNEKKLTAEDWAMQLTTLQAETTQPHKEGKFWVFEGIPRNLVKGQAVTRVATTEEDLLIIISQDPDAQEATHLTASLRGLTPRTKALLAD